MNFSAERPLQARGLQSSILPGGLIYRSAIELRGYHGGVIVDIGDGGWSPVAKVNKG